MSSPIQVQKDTHFRGFARLSVDQLTFETEHDGEGVELHANEAVDQRKVADLLRSYLEDGCHRSDRMHSLPVVAHEEILGQKLASEGDQGTHSFSQLVHNAPLLALPDDVRITCLDGRLRVVAARQFLPVDDRWWTVEVYDAGEHSSTIIEVVEAYDEL